MHLECNEKALRFQASDFGSDLINNATFPGYTASCKLSSLPVLTPAFRINPSARKMGVAICQPRPRPRSGLELTPRFIGAVEFVI
jgi:hypothetical protein